MQMSTSAVDNVDTAPQVASSGSKQLLEDDGALSRDAEAALEVIFRKYATSISATSADSHASSSAAPIEKLSIKPEGLTAFGLETNGQALPQEQIEEIKTYFDCDYHENILFSGFLQMYQLQTEADEAETLRDLNAHGFTDFVASGQSQAT
ncbi:hypothetical protein EMMF5_005404 [Cystobasidiomycetes sp. EMM_F5]